MNFSREELLEAQRQIASILHKLRETMGTLQRKEYPERYKSQITLARRRIAALELAGSLFARELGEEE